MKACLNVSLLIVVGVVLCLSGAAQTATVAYWRFEAGPADTNVLRPDGTSGYTFTPDVPDESGNDNHLAAWSTGGGTGFAYRADVPLDMIPQTNAGNTLSVQNTGDWPAMYTKSETSQPTGIDIEAEETFAQFTIEAFYKATASSGPRTIVGRDAQNVADDGRLSALYLQLTQTSRASIKFVDVSGFYYNAQTDPDWVLPDRWYYYAAVSDGQTLSLYLADIEGDGELQLVAQLDLLAGGSPDTTLAKGPTGGDGWHAGGWSVGRGLYDGGHTDRAFGFIDEVRISNTALSPNQFLYSKGTSAWDPSPANGETAVPPGQILSWKTGRNPDDFDQYNPDITHHYVYFREDPNFLDMTAPTAIIEADGPSASYAPIDLERDQTYYWRVDQILNDGPIDDPNVVIPGAVWRFSTILSAPTIRANGHPSNVIVQAGVDVDFELLFTSFSPAHVTWYRYVDGENDIALTDENGQPLDPAKYAVESNMISEATLTITNVTVDDEAFYYARVTNAEQLSVQSETARLAVRRLVAHYPMDVIDNAVTPNVIGGFDMALVNDGVSDYLPTLADGVDELGANSLLFANIDSADPNFYGQYAQIAPGVADYEQMTLSLWVFWNGGDIWQRIFDFGNSTSDYMFLTPNNGGQCRFAIRLDGGTEQTLSTDALPENEWVYVTTTIGSNTGRLYVNGELMVTNTSMTIRPIDFRPELNYIGKSHYPDPYFNGQIDDMKIYNYVRTTEQVARDYLTVRGDWICNRELPQYEFDFNNDCRVDIADFAIFAEEWLDSNRIYPAQ